MLLGCTWTAIKLVYSPWPSVLGWPAWQQPRDIPIAPPAAACISSLTERAPAWMSPLRDASCVLRGSAPALQGECADGGRSSLAKCKAHWAQIFSSLNSWSALVGGQTFTVLSLWYMFKFRPEDWQSYRADMFKATFSLCHYPEGRRGRLVSARLHS